MSKKPKHKHDTAFQINITFWAKKGTSLEKVWDKVIAGLLKKKWAQNSVSNVVALDEDYFEVHDCRNAAERALKRVKGLRDYLEETAHPPLVQRRYAYIQAVEILEQELKRYHGE